MKQRTRYFYEQKIRGLEASNTRLSFKLAKYESLARSIFEWLAQFAGDECQKGRVPNASFGLNLFREKVLL